MSWLKKVDVAETANNLLSKLDDSLLTQQEKADNTREFVKETLDENTERSRTRRSVTKVIIWNYFIAFWVVLITYFLNAFKIVIVDLNALINIIVDFKVPFAFLAVITFFFGGYYLNRMKRKKPQK